MASATEAEDAARREEELEALRAFYGDDIEAPETNPASGPWRIRIRPEAVLEICLPRDYPSSSSPVPNVCAPQWVLDEVRAAQLVDEMVDMYSPDTEVVIMWAEHCRAVLDDENPAKEAEDKQFSAEEAVAETTVESEAVEEEGVLSFVPATSKFGQPVRNFDAAVAMDEKNRCSIYHGEPFHPPRSGPSEKMVAHVARVRSMEQVNWVLAELLLNDKNVARASHNMVAYKFWDLDRKCLVSDNDDDGEKGSGAKLATLLEMTDANDVIVVVSRWYGGVHLGPSRFKHIASTAREALEAAGFINSPSGEGVGEPSKRKGRKS